jgi:hypothetical protein
VDKATRRKIKLWERKAAETARLKERAANLLKKAGDAELVKKSAFEALIVRTAYAAGLDALPLEAVVSGMAGLASLAKAEPMPAAKDRVAPADKSGGDDVKQDEGAIELIVDIGRNTSEKRFAVLDKYLTWNGRVGEWSGKVTPAVLTIFEALFEPRRLKYSVNELKSSGGESSNTPSQTVDNVADAMRLEENIDNVHPVMSVDAGNQTLGQPETTGPGPGEGATGEAATSEPDHEEVGPGPGGVTEAGSYGLQDPQGTTGPVTSDTSTPAEEPPPFPSAKPTAITRMPRNPFAGLRRHGPG